MSGKHMDYGRRMKDGLKLERKGGYEVKFIDDDVTKFTVKYSAPKESFYEGYNFTVMVELEDEYPRKPPIVYFETKIFHLNIDFDSGFICVSALETDKWDPNFELSHIFDFILPQLLLQPDYSDPYNNDAAELYQDDLNGFKDKVTELCQLYAQRS